MKRRNTSKMAIALVMSAIPLLVGCGSSGSGSNNTPGGGPAIVGYQTVCNANGVCQQVPIYGTAGGCVPLSTPISFYGSGLLLDSMNNIMGGTVPGSGTAAGSMVIGAPTAVSGPTFTSQGVSGTFSMSAQSVGTSIGYTGQGNLSVSGTLTISPILQQQIMYYTGGGYGGTYGSYNPYNTTYPGTTAGTSCVSGIALVGHLYTTGGYGFGGQVYLYLNNTQHGYILNFY